jgi:hypothetical protein
MDHSLLILDKLTNVKRKKIKNKSTNKPKDKHLYSPLYRKEFLNTESKAQIIKENVCLFASGEIIKFHKNIER